MKAVQYRVAAVTFDEKSRPTWGSLSSQILLELARWAGAGWSLSRLNGSPHLRLRARGFCVLLERPLDPEIQPLACGTADRRGGRAA